MYRLVCTKARGWTNIEIHWPPHRRASRPTPGAAYPLNCVKADKMIDKKDLSFNVGVARCRSRLVGSSIPVYAELKDLRHSNDIGE